MTSKLTPIECGYTTSGWEHLTPPEGHEVVKIGYRTKRADLYWVNGWIPLDDSYLDLVIDRSWRPVARRMRWVCWHFREDGDPWCRVCDVFGRWVKEKW